VIDASQPRAADLTAVTSQLGRVPRGVTGIAHRCPCGLPDVVQTLPRLPDGTPFPTLYYLTCPRASAAMSRLEAAGAMREMTARLRSDPRLAASYAAAHRDYLTCPRAVAAVSRLEAAGLMREMTQRTAADPELRRAYQAAHRHYLARRDEAARVSGVEPLPPGTPSAGGMPDRVKCLHALVAHELAAPGQNPLGREAARAAAEWWHAGPCVAPPADPAPADPQAAER